jgi:hypothetical protein
MKGKAHLTDQILEYPGWGPVLYSYDALLMGQNLDILLRQHAEVVTTHEEVKNGTISTEHLNGWITINSKFVKGKLAYTQVIT